MVKLTILIPQGMAGYIKMSVYETSANEYNEKLAEALKKMPEFMIPEWAEYVKTSVARERPPAEEDWWHKRAASILKQIYIKGIVGVERLKTRYGGRKNRGRKPEAFRKGSGKIIRTILQQSDKAGLTEKVTGLKPGRQLTAKGKEFLDSIGGKDAK
jgi:small subunit ribosomal protein S19e